MTVKTNLENNSYEATFEIKEITEEELELLKDYGDIEINVGGDLVDENGDVVASLGNSYKKFPSEFPHSRKFTQAMYGDNTENIASFYVKDITDKIDAGVTNLKSKTDTFSGTTEIIL